MIFKRLLIIIFFTTLFIIINSTYLLAQTANTNYVRTRVPQIAITDTSLLDTIPVQRQAVNIKYSDALGRTLQLIQVQGSANKMDMVMPYVYDNMGRQVYSYMPYADENTTVSTIGALRTNAPNSVLSFYSPANPGAPKMATDQSPYAQTVYEASPLSRVKESGAVGANFQPGTGHTNKISYITNTTANGVNYYYNIPGSTTVPVTPFPAGVLAGSILTDENGHQTVVWKDLQGRTVTVTRNGSVQNPNNPSYYSTDYVYNDLNQLSNIVTAITKKQISLLGSISTNTFIKQSYNYSYDSLGRLVEKKIPGKGWIYIIYNHSNKPVLAQDSNMRVKRQWMFTKYDAEGRLIQSGIYTNTNVISRIAMQYLCDNSYPVLWETRQPGNGYTNNAFPQVSALPASSPLLIYSIYYYDDYSFTEANTKPFQTNIYNTVPTRRTMGMLTGTSIYVLGTDNQRLVSVNYYDHQNRLIQQLEDNHLGQVDVVNNQYNFVSEVVGIQRITTPIAGQALTVKDRYVYDHLGRLLDTYESFQGSAEINLSHNAYNEIAQKVSEGLYSPGSIPVNLSEDTALVAGRTDVASQTIALNPGFSSPDDPSQTYIAAIDTGNFAQTQEFRYNIRGWLTNINNGTLTYDNGVTQSSPNALFGETISYDQPVLNASPQYNGNISAITWRNKIEATELSGVATVGQGYAFTYDQYDRFSQSSYYTQSGNTFTKNTLGALTETIGNNGSAYDEMGNIDSLQRRDKAGNLLNNLSYTYAPGQNQLTGVQDSGSQSINGTFTYDGNGNMTGDSRKGITITYNLMDLPDTVKQGNSKLVFTYDAAGNKLYKQLIVNGSVTSQRHYVEDAELTASSSVAYDGKVENMAISQGRILLGSGNTYHYEFYLCDHLGNTRVTFQPSTGGSLTIGEVQNYYPFGGNMGDATMNYSSTPQNLYLYNGKEIQPELNLNTYDFGARHYDATLGRWTSIDPLSDQYESFSPYNYVENNPLNLVDPNGMGVNPLTYQYGFPIGGGSSNIAGVASSASGFITIGESIVNAWSAFDISVTTLTNLNPNLKTVQGNQTQLNTGNNPNQGGELAPNGSYTIRDGSVRAGTQVGQLVSEFFTGKGPERSLFFGNSNIVKKYLINSRVQAFAVNAFVDGGGKPIDKMTYTWNPWDAFYDAMSSEQNDLMQFLGSVRISVTPVGKMLRIQVDNTTDTHSLYIHLPWIHGTPRNPNKIIPQSTTYQRFIWWVERR